MIKVEQCRAARGLLGWTQDDLGKASGISKTSINNFERSIADTKPETLTAIHYAFFKAGVEFLDNCGVRRRQQSIQILRDDDCYEKLMDDIYETLKDKGGEVLINCVNEKASYTQYPEKLNAHFARLKEANISERLLAEEGDTFFLQPKEYYRWIPSEFYSTLTPTFIYGNKVAIKFWFGKTIIILDDESTANAERQRFELIWAKAKIPGIL